MKNKNFVVAILACFIGGAIIGVASWIFGTVLGVSVTCILRSTDSGLTIWQRLACLVGGLVSGFVYIKYMWPIITKKIPEIFVGTYRKYFK